MRRTTTLAIRDPRAAAVLISAWTLVSRTEQDAAAQAALGAMPATTGLLRYSVFRGLEDLTLVHLSQWSDGAARDAYVANSSTPRKAVDNALPETVRRDWRDPATPHRGTTVRTDEPGTCVVVVRQGLLAADPQLQRIWIDRVLAALDADPSPPHGLLAASFFTSTDGATVLNLAEWTDAHAHRDALTRADDGRTSIGESPEWQAVRDLPGISPEPDVRRYTLVGAVESDDGFEADHDDVHSG